VDSDLRAAWLDRLEHAAGDDGRPPEKLSGSRSTSETPILRVRRWASVQAAGALEHPAPWPGPEQWTDLWYAGQYILVALPPFGQEPRARGRLPRIAAHRRALAHPNGLIWAMSVANYGHAGAWTETLACARPFRR